PGHQAQLKALLPPDRVTQTVALLPPHCRHCHARLPGQPGPDDPEPTRHQVAELPALQATVTEYQGHARTCSRCGALTRAAIPPDLRAHSIGPGLAALMAYLVGSAGLSKRRVEEVDEAVFAVPVALGTVANLERELSAALQPALQ